MRSLLFVITFTLLTPSAFAVVRGSSIPILRAPVAAKRVGRATSLPREGYGSDDPLGGKSFDEFRIRMEDRVQRLREQGR